MKLKNFYLSFFVCFLLVSGEASAQHPYFKPFFVNRDNSNINLNDVCLDQEGFMWLGTSDGLYRFTGTGFSPYFLTGEKNPGEITTVYTSSDSTLWVGCRNGVLAFLQDGELQLKHINDSLEKKITAIFKDSRQYLWVATAGDGIYCLMNDSIKHLNVANGFNDDYVYTLSEDNSGRVWAGTDQGIAVCSIRDKEISINQITMSDNLPDDIVRVIKKDMAGIMWVGLQSFGFCKINPSTFEIEVPQESGNWKYGQVNDILLDKNETWLATQDSGLVNIGGGERNTVKNYTSAPGLNFPKVSRLTKDHEGNLWMTASSRLIRSHDNWLMFLDEYNRKKITYVHAIYSDRNNNLWFTPDQGLAKMQPDNPAAVKIFVITPPEKLIDLVSIYEDRCGYLWLGTMGGGLYRLNPVTGKTQKINEISSGNSSVLSIAGTGNEIWLATFGGAVKITLPENCQTDNIKPEVEKLDKQKEIGNYYIYTVFADSKNRVWFGTDKEGITSFSNGTFTNYNKSHGLKSNTVYSITEDEKGNIWFSAPEEGIYKFDGKSFTNYSSADGLRELTITSLKSCGNNRLMLVHRRGMDIFNTVTKKIDYYGAENNLADINPDINSITTDREGKIWFGTEKGIVVFNPLLNQNPPGAKIILNSVLVSGDTVNYHQVHSFPYNKNYFSFDYTGLWYTDPSRITYRYILDGYNSSWINTGDRNVIFPNLSPGNYTFRVQAALSGNFLAASETSYSFTIENPLWKESWFRVLALLFILGLAFLYLQARDKRLRNLEALKKEKIEFQFETLKNQVNPHFLFNSFNTLIAIIEDNQALAVEYVEKLSEFFRTIVNYKDKELITLEEEVEIASTYFYLQQKRFGKHFTIDIRLAGEIRKKFIPPMVLQMLIENAIKHNSISPETPLKVEIFSDNGRLAVRNNINRKKISLPSTGTGLQNIMNRYKLLANEDVKISDDGKYFIVTLPLINK